MKKIFTMLLNDFIFRTYGSLNANKNIEESYERNRLTLINDYEKGNKEDFIKIIDFFDQKEEDYYNGKTIKISNISKSNITHWKNGTYPSADRVPFLVHSIAKDLSDMNEIISNQMIIYIEKTFDFKDIYFFQNLLELKKSKKYYEYFMNIFAYAYKRKLNLKDNSETVVDKESLELNENIKFEHKNRVNSNIKWILIIIIAIPVLAYYLNFLNNKTIEFQDPVFEDVVRKACEDVEGTRIDGNLKAKQVEKITKLTYDLKNLDTTLWHDSEKILSISGIENLKGLKILNLRGNDIDSLGFLANLTELEELYISGNIISDIDSLKNLDKLKRLDIQSNFSISDIESLRNLRNLEFLNCGYLNIFSIEPISKLTKLKVLYLNKCTAKDLYLIENITSLTDLYLNETNYEDGYEFLKELSNLEYLGLYDNGIEDISFIENFDRLQGLDLSKNNIREVEAIENMEKKKERNFYGLKYLKLDNNLIEDFSPLWDLNPLIRFFARDNPAEKISSLYRAYAYNLNLEKDFNIENIDFVKGNILAPNQENWYSFTPNVTQNFTIFTAESTKTQGAIFDETGKIKVFGGEKNEGDNPRFLVTCLLEFGKNYKIKVRAHGGSVGPYTLYIIGESLPKNISAGNLELESI